MRSCQKILFIIIFFSCDKDEPELVKVTPEKLYSFIKGLIHPQSGLVSSRVHECFTTVYKNSLAVMTLVHEGDIDEAEKILDVFNKYIKPDSSFGGFRQNWNSCTGKQTDGDYWEGDNAFLLLAVNYYQSVTASNRYALLTSALISWIGTRADDCESIVAEGVANMYAALKPHESLSGMTEKLERLGNCFKNSVDYTEVLDHTTRSALVFCDVTGFTYLSNFAREDLWAFDNKTKVKAYSAFRNEDFINVEVSAQLLLAASMFDSPTESIDLERELKKIGLCSDSQCKVAGLPYYVIVPPGVNWDPASQPIIDPTAYLLFYYWNLNPFAPGKQCAR